MVLRAGFIVVQGRSQNLQTTAPDHVMMEPDLREELDISKLSQKRQALQAKMEVLTKLDKEIVEIVNEDTLEEEIEQSDVIRGRLARFGL